MLFKRVRGEPVDEPRRVLEMTLVELEVTRR